MHAFGAVLPLVLAASTAIPTPVQRAMQEVNEDAIRAHVKFLSSDLLEGRGPGTRGDEITTQYLATRFEALGLQPAGDNGTYFQKVSLLGLTHVAEKSSLAFVRDGQKIDLEYLTEFVGLDQSQKPTSTLDSEL
ncbi:MAG TPA: peptidase M28, partial [Candidatus Paceibacterota bacterium]|nr:peptidase M28 [Candidatus Paceibacterota bacterium]